MMDIMVSILREIENFLWSYLGLFLILMAGAYFSIKSKCVQIRGFKKAIYNFSDSFKKKDMSNSRGVNPLSVFFASLGGCIGIGNIVSIAVAIQVGGPGALVWVWVIAFLGMIIKYAEVYLGVRFRVENDSGSFDGGPMYFLRYAFPNFPMIANIMAILMCVYGAEIYLFGVIKESLVENFALPPTLVVISLLALILISVLGGVKRVGEINSLLVPIFIIVFLVMVGYVLWLNLHDIPKMLATIFRSAFSGHAAVGGFAGSTVLLTISKGVSSACYSGDVGIGYASIIHAEAQTKMPEEQASLALVGIFIDTLIICTAVILLVLISGVWQDQTLKGSMLVQTALAGYFPHMDIFMSIFIFMLGFSTITAYMCAGIKAAKYLSPKNGRQIFVFFASFAFIFFSFFDISLALTIMYICGGLLMLINIPGILALRGYVRFHF